MLAQVYQVDDQYILRSRPYEADTPIRFEDECKLCAQVAELTGFRFPEYQRCLSGKQFVIDQGFFWTLHPIIPGRPLGSWFELHLMDPSINYHVLNTLRQLHSMTTGRFDEKNINRARLLELVVPAMAEANTFLTDPALERLHLALDSVKQHCESYPPEMGCFVHGDFHPGNILAHKGHIVGFIDLDWCRVGSFYEDFAFSLMMMMRDYRHWAPEFRLPLYRSLLDAYNFDGDTVLLIDYLILYALFDCAVFKSSTFDNAPAFFKYQQQFLETVCRTALE